MTEDTTKKIQVELIQDGEDLILPIPEEIWEAVGWEIGDVVEFKIVNDNQFVIEKKNES
jgi:antitoxin component of MazEF toxin-antitoxin module